jgi:hypothetical protein
MTAPAAADVGIRIRTWYGQIFRVVESTRRDRVSCERRGSQVSCLARFPALEAQRAGRWTVVVVKTSARPARVRVAVAFEARAS